MGNYFYSAFYILNSYIDANYNILFLFLFLFLFFLYLMSICNLVGYDRLENLHIYKESSPVFTC